MDTPREILLTLHLQHLRLVCAKPCYVAHLVPLYVAIDGVACGFNHTITEQSN